MIAAWMLYSVAITFLLAGAALVGEQIALRNRRATRRAWTLGLAASVLLPVAALVLKDAPAATEVDGTLSAVSPAAGMVMNGVGSMASLDTVLLLAWACVSGALALLLAASVACSWLRCRRLASAEVDGVSVLLTEDVGPAVTGVARPRILLPMWALDAPEGERRMILEHEQAHVDAGDHRLLAFAAAILMAAPWNPAAWFLAHRLRLAIEVDCDRRVMENGRLDTRRYAELLLTVGARRAVPAYAMGFSLGRPFLEARIDRMTARLEDARWSTNLLGAVVVVAVLGAAWALPQPIRAAHVDGHWEFVCPNADTTPVTAKLLQLRSGRS